MDEVKICLMCGVNTNKKQKWERYQDLAPIKKTGKYRKGEESGSESDSDDSSYRSKKKGGRKSSPRVAAATGSRQTRNQNPKMFAASLCKVMEVPDSTDEPFIQIFSRAHYCGDCLGKVKEVHGFQMELERVQARIDEARIDFEIDLSKHLQKIPSVRGMTRNDAYGVYEHDIKAILDYNGSEKKAKKGNRPDETKPKRERRQAAISSALKNKRKHQDNGSEEYDEEEEEKDAKEIKPKKKAKTEEDDVEFLPEETTSSETEKEQSADNDNADEEVKQESSPDNADNGSSDASKDVEEQKPNVNEESKNTEETKPIEESQGSHKKKALRFKCPHCVVGRYFHSEEKLAEHVSTAHKYVCDVCEKTFKFESDMKKHKNIVHIGTGESKNDKYICGFCDKDFELKRELEDHLDQHPQAKPLNCHQCGRGFGRKESLQKGFQIYKGETVEPCQNCGRNLNLKVYLEHNQNLKQ